MMTNYVRLTKTLYDKGRLVPESKVMDEVRDLDSDWYCSIYRYTPDQYKQFKKNGTVIGIEDVRTNQLVFDFDDEQLDCARSDAVVLIERLKKAGIKEEEIQAYFSGNKGFHVIVKLSKELTPDETKKLAIEKYGKGLDTLDVRVYNPNRIFRIENTKHQTSNLYKIPLQIDELKTLKENVIRAVAKKPRSIKGSPGNVANPGEEFYSLPKEKEEPVDLGDIDLSKRPKGWPDYKWALVQGEFEKGERHDALMVIAATCRGIGYTDFMAYYLCKHALKSSITKYGEGGTDADEIWNNIVGSVYSPEWKGGQYSPDNNPWLKKYCEKNGFNVNEDTDQFGILRSQDLATSLVKYLKNIDELTIKTGIPAIDAKVRMSVGNSIGIVAAPSVGKTSLAIQILNQASKENYGSAFFSLDMFRDLVGQTLAQKHTGKTEKELRAAIEESGDYEKTLANILDKEYGNVSFIDRSALTIDEMRKILYYLKDNSENPLRLVVVDYNELVATDLTDSTASTAKVAQELRGLAKELEICMVVLYQPNKITGSPSDPIKSYRSIKGSSAIEQAASIVIGMYRPGFNPEYPEDDKFMSIRVLKNRMGQLASFDLYWDGLTGNIRELLPEEKKLLADVKARKAAEEADKDSGWK